MSTIWHCTCEWAFSLIKSEEKWKNAENCRSKRSNMTNKIYYICDLTDKVKDDTGYLMMYLRVAKYNYVHYLKTTEGTTFTPNDDINVVVPENDSLNEKIDTTISVRICTINMKIFNAQYTCPNCNSEVILDEEYVLCDDCDKMNNC